MLWPSLTPPGALSSRSVASIDLAPAIVQQRFRDSWRAPAVGRFWIAERCRGSPAPARRVKKLMRPADSCISVTRPSVPGNGQVGPGSSLALSSTGTAERCSSLCFIQRSLGCGMIPATSTRRLSRSTKNNTWPARPLHPLLLKRLSHGIRSVGGRRTQHRVKRKL